MDNRILVAFATKYGSTTEIAERIGMVLREAGFQVDIHPVDEVKTLIPYRALVLGSAVYVGQWRTEAVEFLRENEEVLARMPTWFFSSGPTGEGDPVLLMKGWRFPESLKAVADRVHPRDIVFFSGVLDIAKLNFGERLIIKGIKAPMGDYRDWDAITDWAQDIAKALAVEAVPIH